MRSGEGRGKRRIHAEGRGRSQRRDGRVGIEHHRRASALLGDLGEAARRAGRRHRRHEERCACVSGRLRSFRGWPRRHGHGRHGQRLHRDVLAGRRRDRVRSSSTGSWRRCGSKDRSYVVGVELGTGGREDVRFGSSIIEIGIRRASPLKLAFDAIQLVFELGNASIAIGEESLCMRIRAGAFQSAGKRPRLLIARGFGILRRRSETARPRCGGISSDWLPGLRSGRRRWRRLQRWHRWDGSRRPEASAGRTRDHAAGPGCLLTQHHLGDRLGSLAQVRVDEIVDDDLFRAARDDSTSGNRREAPTFLIEPFW